MQLDCQTDPVSSGNPFTCTLNTTDTTTTWLIPDSPVPDYNPIPVTFVATYDYHLATIKNDGTTFTAGTTYVQLPDGSGAVSRPASCLKI